MLKNIVLIGFMGAGKSLVANQLASMTNRPVFSTDQLIEKQAGKTINEIFAEFGEEYFRELEKEIVVQLREEEGAIVDCGGGIVIDADNVDHLRKNGVLFYLKASLATIFERIKAEKHRPLLSVNHPQEELQKLFEQRKSFYEQADYTIDTEKSSWDEVCEAILKVFQDE